MKDYKKKVGENMKKTIVLTLAILMLFSFSTAAADIGGIEITPLWDNMSNVNTEFTFSGNTATATVRADKIAGVTSSFEVSIAVYEQVGSYWLLVDGVYEEPTRSFTTKVTIPTESGKKYKAVFEVVAYSGTNSETFEDTIIKTAPSVY